MERVNNSLCKCQFIYGQIIYFHGIFAEEMEIANNTIQMCSQLKSFLLLVHQQTKYLLSIKQHWQLLFMDVSETKHSRGAATHTAQHVKRN